MRFSLSPGSKFACIAIEDASLADDFKGPLALPNGLWVLTSPPFEADSTWKGWLGSIQAGDYSRSNLLLFAAAPSDRPEVVNDENTALENAVYRLFYGILLHGVPALGAGLVLGGANEKGTVGVRRVATLELHFYHADAMPAQVDTGSFEGAAAVADGIRILYQNAEAPRAVQRHMKPFARLRRGFGALLRGFRERYEDDRLHQFVRALEAVVMPSVGKTQKQFVHRCQAFAGTSAGARAMLNELYGLRSRAEHMNDWREALNAHTDPDGTASLRSFQGELLASEVYLRLLKDSALRALLVTDESIAEFWKGLDHEVRQIWGRPIELEKMVGDRYRRFV